MRRFRDRRDAGKRLADELREFHDLADAVVLALPRGGVPVAFEVARALRAPLDILVVRKLGLPGHEELAMGAISSGGARVLNDHVVRAYRIDPAVIDRIAGREETEILRREQAYRSGRPMLDVRGRTVLVVDDGLATGASMRAAVRALRTMSPARIVVAVPVGSAETCAILQDEADEVVCAVQPEDFYAVGVWYDDFAQTTDEEVRDLLERAASAAEPAHGGHGHA
jgi:predicted phosphoribosyltransferase